MPNPEAITGIGWINGNGLRVASAEVKLVSRWNIVSVWKCRVNNHTAVSQAAWNMNVTEDILLAVLKIHRNKTESISSGKSTVNSDCTVVKLFNFKVTCLSGGNCFSGVIGWCYSRRWIIWNCSVNQRVEQVRRQLIMILVKAKVYRVIFPLSRKCYILEELPVNISTRLINHAVGAALPSHERTAGTCRIGRGCTADLSDYVLWLEQNRGRGQARCSVICTAVGIVLDVVGVGCVPEFPVNIWGRSVLNIIVIIVCAVLRNAARLCCWAVSYGVSACRKSGNFIIITVYGISVGVAHRLGCCAYNSRACFSVIVCGRTVTKMNGCRFAVWVTDKSVLESLKIRNTRCILRCRVTEVQSDFLKLFFVFVPCIGGVPWLLIALWQNSVIWASERRLVNLCYIKINIRYTFMWRTTTAVSEPCFSSNNKVFICWTYVSTT